MGMLNKEQYEYRRESAARRAYDNKTSCDSLTEEQHDLLAEICSMRHEIHCNQSSLYNTGSGSYSEYWHWLSDAADDGEDINSKLKRAGMKTIEWSTNMEEAECDNDRYDGIIDDTDEADEENRDSFYERMESINNDIEAYLRIVDEKHGTDYCPSGFLRIQ
jgi:hypothetical protein